MLCSAFGNVLIILAFYLQISAAFNVGGYVEITITKIENLITKSNFADFSSVRVKKVNRKHVVVGEVKYTNGISNEQNCSVLLFKKQGGEYRKTEFRIPTQGCCDFYNFDTLFIPKFQTHCASCPKQSEKLCPWPPGNYFIDKFEFAIENIPPFMEGEYKTTYQISKGDEILAGYSFYTTIIR